MTASVQKRLAPKPSNASKKSIYAMAELVSEKSGYQPGGSLLGIIRRLGGDVEVSDPFSEEHDETIEIRGKRDFTIFISSFTSDRRDRFTIAHELGHYFLHYLPIISRNPDAEMRATRSVDDSDKEQQRAEWEANWFAAGFLMPQHKFTDAFKRLNNDIPSVADEFAVSEVTAEIRAKNLSLL